MSSASTSQRPSFSSRFARLTDSPVLSAARRWASGKASPKPQPKDPNPRYVIPKYNPNSALNKANNQNTTKTQQNVEHSENENQNQTPITFYEKVVKFSRNAVPRSKKMLEGFQQAASGSWSALTNPKFEHHFWDFFLVMGGVMFTIYSILALLLFVYLPVVFFITTFLPGLIGQLFSLIPLWAFVIARKRYPIAMNQLFIDELGKLCPSRAQELSQLMSGEEHFNKNWIDDLYHDLRTSWHFTRYSLACLPFSFIPVVGPFITYFGQVWIIADKMGWNLLSVYTISAKKMSYRQQKHWMRARKWRVMGFTLPFTVLASLPIVGPMFLGLAQGAMAHLYFHLLSKENETDKKQDSTPQVEFKRAV